MIISLVKNTVVESPKHPTDESMDGKENGGSSKKLEHSSNATDTSCTRSKVSEMDGTNTFIDGNPNRSEDEIGVITTDVKPSYFLLQIGNGTMQQEPGAEVGSDSKADSMNSSDKICGCCGKKRICRINCYCCRSRGSSKPSECCTDSAFITHCTDEVVSCFRTCSDDVIKTIECCFNYPFKQIRRCCHHHSQCLESYCDDHLTCDDDCCDDCCEILCSPCCCICKCLVAILGSGD
ncbi:hypothetical protein CWI37_0153p0040 [Hamiltosporidium tvaerminnensis]|uniref:Uncharacterized protein n=1 Tax=Hamiltosporidium tvaerminnensis TaxID=1176355 RepID=A0A4Q9LAI0_9MICR|nr:hypothetical protein CWI37_0153p0040 [Hamiltosporidium tvaerminnensis]